MGRLCLGITIAKKFISMNKSNITTKKKGEAKEVSRSIKEKPNTAMEFLRSLPRKIPPIGKNALRDREPSRIIESEAALEFVNIFREGTNPIDIPVSWSFDKAALLNLLGITDCEHYEEVNGIRFYAGVNSDGILTLVAVSTTHGTRENCSDCRNDLTEDDEYPYYDYADPCPTNCSDLGNLRATDESLKRFERVD